jgi:hypothetical protein
LISLVSKKKQNEIARYALPIAEGTITAKITHEYITNCGVLSDVSTYLYIIEGGYAFLIALWVSLIWYVYTD